MSSASLAFILGLAAVVAGQYFPPTPEGVKVVESKHQEGVKISYKEVRILIYLRTIGSCCWS